jgi:TolB-like protein/Tfp pilus assembly protein PilF
VSPKRSWASARALLALLAIAAVGVLGWRAMWPADVRVRLAVLPFEAINLDPARRYLTDALHDETIAALGQIDPAHIEVIARRSMLQYADRAKPLPAIARELGVEYLVESAIHAENGHVRVTARLIRARDQAQIWTNAYDNEPGSWLEFQRRLSATIAEQIQLKVSPERLEALARRHTRNPAAFQLYLEGLAAWNQLNAPQSTLRALGLYTKATELDPEYALPWAGLALAYAGAPINGDANPRVMEPLARRAAQRAMAADARLAEALTAMGAVNFWFDWDWPSAEMMFSRALQTDPNYAFAQRMIGIVQSHEAVHRDAQEAMRRLVDMEPEYEMNWSLRAQVAFNARQHRDAIQWARRASALQPGFWIADYHLASAFEQIDENGAALETLDRRLGYGIANSKLLALRGYILGKTGRTAEARQVLDSLNGVTRTRPDQFVPPYARALIYAGMRDRTSALQWLERAYEARDVHLIALPTDPKWDPLRGDPAFRALLERCRFALRSS